MREIKFQDTFLRRQEPLPQEAIDKYRTLSRQCTQVLIDPQPDVSEWNGQMPSLNDCFGGNLHEEATPTA